MPLHLASTLPLQWSGSPLFPPPRHTSTPTHADTTTNWCSLLHCLVASSTCTTHSCKAATKVALQPSCHKMHDQGTHNHFQAARVTRNKTLCCREPHTVWNSCPQTVSLLLILLLPPRCAYCNPYGFCMHAQATEGDTTPSTCTIERLSRGSLEHIADGIPTAHQNSGNNSITSAPWRRHSRQPLSAEAYGADTTGHNTILPTPTTGWELRKLLSQAVGHSGSRAGPALSLSSVCCPLYPAAGPTVLLTLNPAGPPPTPQHVGSGSQTSPPSRACQSLVGPSVASAQPAGAASVTGAAGG